jgi:hypothetical protein
LSGRLAEAAQVTVVGSYRLDIRLQEDQKYQIMHLLAEDSYMMKIVGDKKPGLPGLRS